MKADRGRDSPATTPKAAHGDFPDRCRIYDSVIGMKATHLVQGRNSCKELGFLGHLDLRTAGHVHVGDCQGYQQYVSCELECESAGALTLVIMLQDLGSNPKPASV